MLEEKLDRTSAKAWYCDLHSEWKVLWLSLSGAARPDCLLDDLLVYYDDQTGRCVHDVLHAQDAGASAGSAADQACAAGITTRQACSCARTDMAPPQARPEAHAALSCCSCTHLHDAPG